MSTAVAVRLGNPAKDNVPYEHRFVGDPSAPSWRRWGWLPVRGATKKQIDEIAALLAMYAKRGDQPPFDWTKRTRTPSRTHLMQRVYKGKIQ
jgi:hypothetical protein